MRFPRLPCAIAVIGAGLLLSGCVASGHGPGPVYYGGYGWAYGGRYVYPPSRVGPPPRHYHRRDARPRPSYHERRADRGRPTGRPPADYYGGRDHYRR